MSPSPILSFHDAAHGKNNHATKAFISLSPRPPQRSLHTIRHLSPFTRFSGDFSGGQGAKEGATHCHCCCCGGATGCCCCCSCSWSCFKPSLGPFSSVVFSRISCSVVYMLHQPSSNTHLSFVFTSAHLVFYLIAPATFLHLRLHRRLRYLRRLLRFLRGPLGSTIMSR